MTRQEALISLNMIPGVGSVVLSRLLEYLEKPEKIFQVSAEKLIQISGINQQSARGICAFKKEDLEKDLALAKKQGLRIMVIEDKDYPRNLKQIPGAPIVLYLKGELKKEDQHSIGIVGSRRASFYGLNKAQEFAAQLSEKKFTITSGMARGVDTCAHKGALKSGGRTIAIMGSGFKHIYPPENKEFAEEIAKNGAVISEFPMETRPLPHNFPRRNRLISGLSLGVLVVEAARNSGALITADFALEQGREVFALPGKVDSETSFGTNSLIKQGAKLVSCIEDILEELNLDMIQEEKHQPHSDGEENRGSQREGFSSQESTLYNLLSSQPLLLDDIVESTQMSIPLVSDILLRLQIRKLIKQLPGRQFIRT